jgi:hypothetical protein
MHTKSSKQVLSPLADAVSALIIIISDSEISGTPTPNLTQLSKAVDTQIRNLVVVAKKIAAQPISDERLKKEMPVVCNLVAEASSILVGATADLLQDPKSQKGRQDLLEGVKGILKGTSGILDVFDESEILKILTATASLRTLLSQTLSLKVDPTGHDEFLHATKKVSQCVLQIEQLCTKRTKDMLSSQMESDLKRILGALREETLNYISTCRILLSQPNSNDAKMIFITSQKLLEKISLNIEDLIKCKDTDEFYEQKSLFYKVVSLKNAHLKCKELIASSASIADLTSNCENYIATSKKYLGEVNGIIKLTRTLKKDCEPHGSKD